MASTIQPPPIERLAKDFPELEIIELIGRGGMGAVYKARQRNLDRLVALKIFLVRDTHPQFEDRFLREARTLAKLNHPNIVTVFDFGQRGECHFLLMEYVDGLNLRQVSEGTRLSSSHALDLVPKLCDALQFAHDNGVVHRDIKPENVLMDQNGHVKIADFGLAKITNSDVTSLTQTQQVMGTINYMAPEQRERPTEVDHRADIYSLGVVIYELLTGELPLGRFQPPSKKVHVDVRLDEVVLKALEKEPELRYQCASEFKSGIQNATGFDHPATQPAKPIKDPNEIYPPDSAQSVEIDNPDGELYMKVYFLIAGVIGALSGVVFIMGSDQLEMIDEDLSQLIGVLIAMVCGYLFAISGFVRKILGARPEEEDDQEHYDNSSRSGAIVSMLAMFLGFAAGGCFVARGILDSNEQVFMAAGIALAVLCGVGFMSCGVIDEIGKRNERRRQR
jgi:serine/threonine protein kinase